MAKVTCYRELFAWQKAMDLVAAVYEATAALPAAEQFGLTAQTRRAATSIAANIAEGQGRRSTREFAHHLGIAHGSLRETETLLLVASRLHYLDTNRVDGLLDLASEVGRLINGLGNSLPGGGYSERHK